MQEISLVRSDGLSMSLGVAAVVLLRSQVVFQHTFNVQAACKGGVIKDPVPRPTGHCPTLSLGDQSPFPKPNRGKVAGGTRQSPPLLLPA